MRSTRRRRWAVGLATVGLTGLVTCAPPVREAGAEGRNVSPESQARELIAASDQGTRPLAGEPLSVALEVPAEGRERLAALASGAPAGSLRLVLDGVELLRRGASYEVYLEPPAGGLPEPEDPSFVGHLAVFGSVSETPPSSRSFDVTERLRALFAAGPETSVVRVLFVPGEAGETEPAEAGETGLEVRGPALRLGAVSIVSGGPDPSQ